MATFRQAKFSLPEFHTYVSVCAITVKVGRLLELLLFTERGVGVYKRLKCSQSIFKKPKYSDIFCLFYHFSTMFSYCMNLCSRLRTVKSIC